MAITGVHTLLYTSEPEALRSVLADVFGWDHVDAGEGWLIFRLPPAELGVHPSEKAAHQISLMCDDIEATVAELKEKGIPFTKEPTDVGFGIEAVMTLPGDVSMMVYEPRHNTAI